MTSNKIHAVSNEIAGILSNSDLNAECGIVALAVVVARMLYGVGELKGDEAMETAVRLLDESIDSTLHSLGGGYDNDN